MYLRHQSNKAYDTLREGGIALPSQRTLRDYTYCCKAVTGFSKGVDEQLLLASKVLTCETWQKYVIILVDEMYIRYLYILEKNINYNIIVYFLYMYIYREDLVFDKHTGSLIGYTDLGEVNNHLLAVERSLQNGPDEIVKPAKSMLTFMVKGLFNNLKFPYAQFSSTKLFQLFCV